MKFFIKSVDLSLHAAFLCITSRSMSAFLRMMTCICLLGVGTILKACPTCLGNLDLDTPPLFSQDYEKQYALYDDGTLEIPGSSQESVNEIQS